MNSGPRCLLFAGLLAAFRNDRQCRVELRAHREAQADDEHVEPDAELRGEINAANTTIKRHFGEIYETRYQEALLPCLQLLRCDLGLRL